MHVGSFQYESNGLFEFQIKRAEGGRYSYEQKTQTFGEISETMEPSGGWFEVKTNHGTLRIKTLGETQLVSQFKPKSAHFWNSEIIVSDRVSADVGGAWMDKNDKQICVNTR
eukprot:UN04406